ncbi:MAG: trimeric intracellular cation channel family protein [Balneolaceae bacterium]|nr:trimeric intracellular cation channel family protein [Balneolaceae bacterium]
MDFISILDLIGTFVFAISGIRMAARKNLDIFGAAVIGFVTAIGGGTTRDILLGSQPVTWMGNMLYPIVILSAIPFTYLIRNHFKSINKPLFIFDTLGIALFTISGMEKALDFGLNPFMAATMGMTSAVVGGIIRDVLCREVPLIFREEIYATACLTGAMVFYIGIEFNLPEIANYLLTTSVIVGIRVAAIKFDLQLPKMKA